MKPSDKKDRAVDLEEAFFAKQNAQLLEKLQAQRKQEESRELLRQVVGIEDSAFLDHLTALGITPETALALRLVPLVFVAWADGHMDDREREAILRAAEEQGLAGNDTVRQVLKNWLDEKPEPRLLTVWKDYVRHLLGSLDPGQQTRMREKLLAEAEQVAGAAGGFLGLAKISGAEAAVIDDLRKAVG